MKLLVFVSNYSTINTPTPVHVAFPPWLIRLILMVHKITMGVLYCCCKCMCLYVYNLVSLVLQALYINHHLCATVSANCVLLKIYLCCFFTIVVGRYYSLHMSTPPECVETFSLYAEFSNSLLQKLTWKYFWPHFEKQDGCHGHFFDGQPKLLHI